MNAYAYARATVSRNLKQIQTRAQPEESLKHNHRQVCAAMVMF